MSQDGAAIDDYCHEGECTAAAESDFFIEDLPDEVT